MDNAELIRQLAERWNAGDLDGVVELYTEDADDRVRARLARAGDVGGTRAGSRPACMDFGAVWESARVEIGPIERHGDKIVGNGDVEDARRVERRGGHDALRDPLHASGMGRSQSMSGSTDHDAAVAAARGS